MCKNEIIKFDPRSYRVHSDENKLLISKSLAECGAGRSILVDRNNIIIAGNGVYEQAQALGLNVRVVESDGKELIVVKRTDLTTDDDKRKLLSLADNRTSDTSYFDFLALVEDFGVDVLGDWNMDIPFDEIPTDIDGFFMGAGEVEKKKKFITCPYCGKKVEV